MKETKEGIAIVQVMNGYKLTVGFNPGVCSDEYVFQSFSEMVTFLKEHFDHRANYLTVD